MRLRTIAEDNNEFIVSLLPHIRPVAVSLARTMYNPLSPNDESIVNDLTQIAMVEIIQAIKKNPEIVDMPTSFFTRVARRAIIRGGTKTDGTKFAPMFRVGLPSTGEKNKNTLRKAEYTSGPKDKAIWNLDRLPATTARSATQATSPYGEQPQASAHKQEEQRILTDVIKTLQPKDQWLAQMMMQGKTMPEIAAIEAEKTGKKPVSKVAIHHRIERLKTKLLAALQDAGITESKLILT